MEEAVGSQPLAVRPELRTLDIRDPENPISYALQDQSGREPHPGVGYFFAYKFTKIHRTLRISPPMAAGVTDWPWDVNDLVALWESYERGRREQ